MSQVAGSGQTVAASGMSKRQVSIWLVALIVVIPTFMEVLDTTIVNVALTQIAGGLQAAINDSEWAITSYLAANAIILPISGWISARLGRRNYFLLSIGLFTLASAFCGYSTSLGELIFFRVIQGLAGGGLQPSSQSILFDIFPKEKQGLAMSIFGVAALLAPVIGPTLGGVLTDDFSWRWIFYINVPVGIIAWIACRMYVEDPEYLQKERAELLKRPTLFDTTGLCLLSLVMVCWETLMSNGQEWDWFGDPFYRVQVLSALFVLGLGSLIYRELRCANPILSFKPLGKSNFLLCCIIIFFAFAVLYGSSTMLPNLVESLMGYNATDAGLLLSPSGVAAILALIIVGIAMNHMIDSRILIGIGLAVLAVGNIWLAKLNFQAAPTSFVWPRCVVVMGISLIFAPINVAAFNFIPPELRAGAVGLFALLRNEGGSFGTSIFQTILQQREQFHNLRVNEFIDPFNSKVVSYLQEMTAAYRNLNYGPVISKQMALESLSNMIARQASGLAYFDCFWVMGVVSTILVFGVFLMKRSVAEKGAVVGAE